VSKGSVRRPQFCSEKEMKDRWELAFPPVVEKSPPCDDDEDLCDEKQSCDNGSQKK